MQITLRRGPTGRCMWSLAAGNGSYRIGESFEKHLKSGEHLRLGDELFYPNGSLQVQVDGNAYRLAQNGTIFAEGHAENIDFILEPRRVVQIPSLNHVLNEANQLVFPVFACGNDYVGPTAIPAKDLPKMIKAKIRKGLTVSHRDYVFTGREKVCSSDGVCFLRDSDGALANNYPVTEYFEITVSLPQPANPPSFDVLESGSFKAVYSKITSVCVAQLQSVKSCVSIASLFNRAHLLTKYGIFWSEAFERIGSILGIDTYSSTLKAELPFEPSTKSLVEDRERRAVSDPEGSLYLSIVSPLRNALVSYINLFRNEATLNNRLWTPILDSVFLPNEDQELGSLWSCSEFPLNSVPGFERALRADYALILKEASIPLLITEYASGQGERDVHKDLLNGSIQLAAVMYDLVGRYRHYPSICKKLECFLLLVAGTRIEIAIMRPLFDQNLVLKGMSLTTGDNLVFDLLKEQKDASKGKDPAGPREPLNVELDRDDAGKEPIRNSAGIYDLKEEQENLISAAVEEKLRIVDLMTYDTRDMSLDCPSSIDLSKVDFGTIYLLRDLGLYLHRISKDLSEEFDQMDKPPKFGNGYAFSTELQDSPYLHSITSKQTPKATRDSLGASPKASSRQAVKEYLWNDGYVITKTVRKGHRSYLFRAVDPHNVTALFQLKPKNDREVTFLTDYADELSWALPFVVTVQDLEEFDAMLVGFEQLSTPSRILFSHLLWYTCIAERLGALLVDLMLVIEKFSSLGYIHGNICPDNIGYSRSAHHWKLQGFDNVQVENAGMPRSLGTEPFIDPNVKGGASKTVQSDLYSLALVIESFLDTKVFPKMMEEKWPEANLKNLHDLRDLAHSLKSHPSLHDALIRVRAFYERFRDCPKWMVRKNKMRFLRLNRAIKKTRPSAWLLSSASASSAIPMAGIEPILPEPEYKPA